jgi:hypothetical protein
MTDEELFLKFIKQIGLEPKPYSRKVVLTKDTIPSTNITYYTFWQQDYGDRTVDFNFDKDGKYVDFLIEGGHEY